MPKKAFRYVCPYCDTDYATEEEAEDCLNGHMMSDIYRAKNSCASIVMKFLTVRKPAWNMKYTVVTGMNLSRKNGVAVTTASFALWRCAGRCPVPLTILPQAARPVPSGVK